jgi:uncharacterized protein YgiM (DUF1202 family)
MNAWQKLVAIATLVGPALTASATAVSASLPQEITSPTLERISLPNRNIRQFAQASDTCWEVSARGSGLYVRQEPTVGSATLGILRDGQNVNIMPGGTENWAPISAPIEGYVYRGYLAPCQERASNLTDTCREATTRLNVRQEPSLNSPVVGTLANGRNIAIANRGRNGWVPIVAPLEGYVSADYLTYCF